jgi:hypothetical protein
LRVAGQRPDGGADPGAEPGIPIYGCYAQKPQLASVRKQYEREHIINIRSNIGIKDDITHGFEIDLLRTNW